jgi:cytokinesis protein
LYLLNELLDGFDDLDVRLHHRSQLQTAGLNEVVDLCRQFNYEPINLQLQSLQDILDEDEARLKEQIDVQMMASYNDPRDVYDAVRSRLQGSDATNHFLSIMQHLLLIREDGSSLVNHYRLLDSVVADVVLDKKLAGAESRLGSSVSRLIAAMNDTERIQSLDAEVQQLRAQALRLKLEKETLQEEVSQGEAGMVGRLKDELARLEEKLNISRTTTARLQGQLESQKAGYEEQIAQLEAQIMELFRIVKELGSEMGRGVQNIIEKNSGMDRKQLIDTLERHMQRTKTIGILEGRQDDGTRKKRGQRGEEGFSTSEDEEEGPSSPLGQARKPKSKALHASATGQANGVPRVSQFMDADDEEEMEQMEQQLAAGVNAVCRFLWGSCPFSNMLSSIHHRRGLSPALVHCLLVRLALHMVRAQRMHHQKAAMC